VFQLKTHAARQHNFFQVAGANRSQCALDDRQPRGIIRRVLTFDRAGHRARLQRRSRRDSAQRFAQRVQRVRAVDAAHVANQFETAIAAADEFNFRKHKSIRLKRPPSNVVALPIAESKSAIISRVRIGAGPSAVELAETGGIIAGDGSFHLIRLAQRGDLRAAFAICPETADPPGLRGEPAQQVRVALHALMKAHKASGN
jgi:hypothetical protein